MGRNFHKTEDYIFTDSSGKRGSGTDGQVVIADKGGNYLAAFFNDSFHSALLETYWAGYHKGLAAGSEKARQEMRRALGVDEAIERAKEASGG